MRSSCWVRALVVLSAFGMGACQSPKAGARDATGGQAGRGGRPNDVYKVVCFFPMSMWQSFDAAGDQNPEGFRFTMYLISKSAGKGVAVDGMLHVNLYVVEKDDEGRANRRLVQTCSKPVSELAHSEKPSRMGYAYVPFVNWGDADVYGKDVEIAVQYEPPGGRLIQAQTKAVKVPARKD